jgi:hypothetical protein
MARYTVQEFIEIIKAPKYRPYIEAAKEQEDRLIFHCEPILDRYRASHFMKGYFQFVAWVRSFLPKDKQPRFEQLLTLPVETVDSTEIIFDELSKVFDAHDKHVKIEFITPELEDDFVQYLETIKEEGFWSTTAFEALKTAINSFVVVDLPPVQITPRPEPYTYILPISHVHDALVSNEGRVEYLIFWQDGGSMVAMDDDFIRVFQKPIQAEEWRLISEIPHLLGYAPACPFYNQNIKGSANLNKRGPITSTLGKLDWLLFWKTSKKYLDLYGAWPIIVSYKEDCKYRDADDNQCFEGYINYEYCDPNGNVTHEQKRCPACEAKGAIGPGSYWTVDPPRDATDVDLLKNPVTIVEISNDKLEYGVTEIMRLEDEIYFNSVGFDGEAIADQAVNTEQVRAQFESRTSILTRIKDEFQRCRKFSLETMAILRYGDYFIKATVSGGSEFFLKDPADLAEEYANGKKNGFPQFEIGNLREKYMRTKYKSNPQAYERSKILALLEPYPDLSLMEIKMMGIQFADPDSFVLKSDFNNFVSQFERENANVLEFGKLIPLSQKINIIKTKLLDYVREQRKKTAVSSPYPGPVNPATGGTSSGQ